MNEDKLDSLITLLDDPDAAVFNIVLEELLKEDISIVDQLEHIWETSLDGLVQQRIEMIIQKIQLNDTTSKIKNWANQEAIDLFEGFFLISRHHYPELKLKPIQVQLDKIRKDVWLEYRNSLTALEKITILNHIFFDHYKFEIDQFNPYSPQNCFINRILDLRKGNPVSIAILYTLIARSLDLPVHYIDFETNPLIGYFDKEIAQIVQGENFKHSVLFFINPSNKGAIIGPKEVDYLQNTHEVQNRQKLTEPCPDRIVLKRLVEKLVIAYQDLGIDTKAQYMNEIASIL
jgi:hypothetical protein